MIVEDILFNELFCRHQLKITGKSEFGVDH